MVDAWPAPTAHRPSASTTCIDLGPRPGRADDPARPARRHAAGAEAATLDELDRRPARPLRRPGPAVGERTLDPDRRAPSASIEAGGPAAARRPTESTRPPDPRRRWASSWSVGGLPPRSPPAAQVGRSSPPRRRPSASGADRDRQPSTCCSACYAEPESIAVKVLDELGLDRAERRPPACSAVIGRRRRADRSATCPFAAAAPSRRSSWRSARRSSLGHNYIGTEHILLGRARAWTPATPVRRASSPRPASRSTAAQERDRSRPAPPALTRSSGTRRLRVPARAVYG